MIDTDDFISKNFKTAWSIHTHCEKLNLSADMTRLLTYIHFRYKNMDESTDLIHSEISDVIDFMQNKNTRIFPEESICYAEIIKVPKKMKSLDLYLKENHGFETRISSELNYRARFHRDSTFRNKMMSIYREKILPCLAEEEIVS